MTLGYPRNDTVLEVERSKVKVTESHQINVLLLTCDRKLTFVSLILNTRIQKG